MKRELERQVGVGLGTMAGNQATFVVRFHNAVLACETCDVSRTVELAFGRVTSRPIDEDTFEVRVDEEPRLCRVGERTRILGAELDVTVDTTDDGAVAASDASFGSMEAATVRSGAIQALSLALHVVVVILLYTQRAHFVDDADVTDLRHYFSPETLPIPVAAEGGADASVKEKGSESSSANDAAKKKIESAPGSVGPGISDVAARGRPHEPSTGRRNPSPTGDPKADALAEVEAFGMNGLLAVSAHQGPTSWGGTDAASDGNADGLSWGDTLGSSTGAGGIGLSGTGSGAGGPGVGIGMGTVGGCGGARGCGFASVRAGAGRVGGTHKSKPPRVCGAYAGETPKCTGGSVSGRLPPEVIQRVMRQSFGRFRLCYENKLRMQPPLDTRVAISFTIGRDGAVSSARVAEDSSLGVGDCVANAMYGVSFPAPEGGVVRVTYPIVFSPG